MKKKHEDQCSHERVHLSANSDQELTYAADSFFLILWGGGLLQCCQNRQQIINTLQKLRWWGEVGLCLCLSISPLPHNSQQNNKWKHKTGPLSYQLIMGLMQMDDSSDRAQLLYKLIKPSLHPASLCRKGQSRSDNDSEKRRHMRAHAHTCVKAPQLYSFTIKS